MSAHQLVVDFPGPQGQEARLAGLILAELLLCGLQSLRQLQHCVLRVFIIVAITLMQDGINGFQLPAQLCVKWSLDAVVSLHFMSLPFCGGGRTLVKYIHSMCLQARPVTELGIGMSGSTCHDILGSVLSRSCARVSKVHACKGARTL